jgi:hypothetical protein
MKIDTASTSVERGTTSRVFGPPPVTERTRWCAARSAAARRRARASRAGRSWSRPPTTRWRRGQRESLGEVRVGRRAEEGVERRGVVDPVRRVGVAGEPGGAELFGEEVAGGASAGRVGGDDVKPVAQHEHHRLRRDGAGANHAAALRDAGELGVQGGLDDVRRERVDEGVRAGEQHLGPARGAREAREERVAVVEGVAEHQRQRAGEELDAAVGEVAHQSAQRGDRRAHEALGGPSWSWMALCLRSRTSRTMPSIGLSWP